jgi:nitrogen fixation/metabolism regulation signal transduction histidine kinase
VLSGIKETEMAAIRIADVNKKVDEVQDSITQLVTHTETIVAHLSQQRIDIDTNKAALDKFRKMVYITAVVLAAVSAACLSSGVL